MEDQIKHFILQLFFSRNNPKMFNKVIRDMKKAHPEKELQQIVATIREKMDTEGLSFIAPAADKDEFKEQVKGALKFLEDR